jgi:hypothetical protein
MTRDCQHKNWKQMLLTHTSLQLHMYATSIRLTFDVVYVLHITLNTFFNIEQNLTKFNMHTFNGRIITHFQDFTPTQKDRKDNNVVVKIRSSKLKEKKIDEKTTDVCVRSNCYQFLCWQSRVIIMYLFPT